MIAIIDEYARRDKGETLPFPGRSAACSSCGTVRCRAGAVTNTDLVMPGLVPGIHVFVSAGAKQDVDGRDKPGHDSVVSRAGHSTVIAGLDRQSILFERLL